MSYLYLTFYLAASYHQHRMFFFHCTISISKHLVSIYACSLHLYAFFTHHSAFSECSIRSSFCSAGSTTTSNLSSCASTTSSSQTHLQGLLTFIASTFVFPSYPAKVEPQLSEHKFTLQPFLNLFLTLIP